MISIGTTLKPSQTSRERAAKSVSVHKVNKGVVLDGALVTDTLQTGPDVTPQPCETQRQTPHPT